MTASLAKITHKIISYYREFLIT